MLGQTLQLVAADEGSISAKELEEGFASVRADLAILEHAYDKAEAMVTMSDQELASYAKMKEGIRKFEMNERGKCKGSKGMTGYAVGEEQEIVFATQPRPAVEHRDACPCGVGTACVDGRTDALLAKSRYHVHRQDGLCFCSQLPPGQVV